MGDAIKKDRPPIGAEEASGEEFAKEVLRACALVREQGPLKKSLDGQGKPTQGSRVAWGKRLVEAVKSFDVGVAEEALANGAKLRQAKGPSLVDIWRGACAVLDEEEMARERGEGKALAMLRWLDARAQPLTHGGTEKEMLTMASAQEAGGAALKKERQKRAVEWVNGWAIKNEVEKSALLSILDDWSKSRDARARVSPQDVLDKVAEACFENKTFAMPLDLEFAAEMGERFGVSMGASKWREFAGFVDSVGWNGQTEELARALRSCGKEKLDEETSASLLWLALEDDSLDLLEAVGLRAKSLSWLLPSKIWDFVGDKLAIRLAVANGKPRPVSALHFALMSNRRMEGASGALTGRECFRALCEIEAAVIAARENPLPAALVECGIEELLDLQGKRGWLLGDEKWNVAHEKALSGGVAVGAEFKKMMGTSLRSLLTEKNKDGATALGMLVEQMDEGLDRARWESYVAKWERSEMAKEASRPRAGMKARRSRL